MKRLEINGVFADLSNDPVGYTWQYFDIFDPTKRFNPYTTTIKLPKTPKNVALLGYGSAPTGHLDVMRDIPNCNYYFGPYKIISNGYLKVQNIDEKNINVQLVSRTELIDRLNNTDIKDVFDYAASMTGWISSSYSGMLSSISYGVDGWLLPRTIEEPITSSTWNIMPIFDEYSANHELWASIALLMDAIAERYGCIFVVAEGGSLIDLQSSNIYTNQLTAIFTPAWNYVIWPSMFPNDWYVLNNQDGRRTIEGETFEYSDVKLLNGKNAWELIKLVAQLTCSMLWVDGDVIYLAPLDEIDTFTDMDFSGRVKNAIKYPNLSGLEAKNYLRYTVSDNTPQDYGESIIEADVHPENEKDYITLEVTLPGRYYDTTEAKTLWKTKYQDCSDAVILLHRGTEQCWDTIEYTSGGTTLSQLINLRTLRPVILLTDYISIYIAAIKGIYYEADIGLNLYDMMQLKPYKLVRINELGGLFYLNKINNYDPYSDKPAKCQLIKYAKLPKPLDLEVVAARFIKDWANDFLDYNVILSNYGGTIYFTSSDPGNDFTGSTIVTQLAEDLDGNVATEQVNVTAKKRKDKIVFSGTSGSGNCKFNDVTHPIYIITTLSSAILDFVNNYAANYLANNVHLTSNGVDTLYFEMTTAGTDATGTTTFTQLSPDIAGTVSTIQSNVVAVARKDSVTLISIIKRGLINITCNGLTRMAGLIIK